MRKLLTALTERRFSEAYVLLHFYNVIFVGTETQKYCYAGQTTVSQ